MGDTTEPKLNQAKYANACGSKCPFCESEDIEGASVHIDAGAAYQEVGCNECGKEWHDLYQLTGYELKE